MSLNRLLSVFFQKLANRTDADDERDVCDRDLYSTELDNKQNKACSAPAHHARLDAFKLREKDSAIWHIPEKQKRGI